MNQNRPTTQVTRIILLLTIKLLLIQGYKSSCRIVYISILQRSLWLVFHLWYYCMLKIRGEVQRSAFACLTTHGGNVMHIKSHTGILWCSMEFTTHTNIIYIHPFNILITLLLLKWIYMHMLMLTNHNILIKFSLKPSPKQAE
jgi:hypothetical protein